MKNSGLEYRHLIDFEGQVLSDTIFVGEDFSRLHSVPVQDFTSAKIIVQFNSPASSVLLSGAAYEILNTGVYGPITGWKASSAWHLAGAIKRFIGDAELAGRKIYPEYVDGELFIVARVPESEISPWPV
jgi:hypothetical protein